MRDITRPAPGFWMIRLVRGGPEVPACIVYETTTHEPGDPSNQMERPGCMQAYISGEPVALHVVWETRGRAITSQEYAYQIADQRWHEANAPVAPKANPTDAIDLNNCPLPF